MRAIAKAQGTSASAVNKAIDRWAPSMVNAEIRKHTRVELARLDELQETFYARALEGDVQCGALVTKAIERSPAYAANCDAADRRGSGAKSKTSTDKIERVLNALLEVQKKRPLAERSGKGAFHEPRGLE